MSIHQDVSLQELCRLSREGSSFDDKDERTGGK
jgi:hypothetical protein